MKVQNILFIFICINMLFGIDYDSHIQPIFNQNCTSCHGNSGGLNLTSYDTLMAGGGSGDVIDAYNAENSLLWQRVKTGEMPETGEPLSEALVNLIGNWINNGAESNTPESEALLMARGNVFLNESDNQNNYGVSIIFNRYSPLPEINDTILSFQDASFYYLADSGSYNIQYQMENYLPIVIPEIEISEAIVLDDIILLYCSDEYMDSCGVCNGDDSTCADCSGVPNGSAVEDNFGTCCTSIDNIDYCGLCEGPGIPDGECDCNGNLLDICGVCGGVSEDLNNNGICDEDEDGMVHAWGLVSLEDTTDFSDVSIIFERYSPTIDTLVFITNTLGEFSVLIDVGIYNIHFEKNGWKTVTMSNQPLIDDLDFGTIVLETGYLVEVSGEISGIWESLNDYFVIGDITIPEGDTLTIKPGVNIYFDGMYNIISEGIIIADGEENAPILFTSNQPVPQPNDWGVIELHSPNNVFRFVQYQYAANGIEGHEISGSIFENCTLTDLPVWPDEPGRWHCHAFAIEGCNDCVFNDNVIDASLYHGIEVESSSNNITITNNVINIYGMAIHINNPSNSILSFNDITADQNVYGIEADNCDGCVIEGNNIQVPNGSGIKSQYSDSLTIINNTLNTSQYGFYLSYGSGHLVNENTITTSSTGIYIRDGSNHQIQENTITGTDDYAIDYYCSQNVTVENNNLYPKGDYTLYNTCNNINNLIINNTIEYDVNSDYVQAINVYNTAIQGNVIKAATSGYSNSYAISGYGNTIQENEIYFYSGYSDREAIHSSSSDHCLIENNYIEFSGNISAIEGSNFSIINNQIIGINNSSGYAINQSTPDNNLVITNNTILTGGNGIWISGGGFDFAYNLIKVGRLGVEVTNYSSGSILNNTILGSSLDEGILIRENSNISIINNIISNFNVGIEAQTDINTITFNDFWQINSSFTAGTGIPSFVGELNTYNANGDPCDVYGNINNDPLFIDGENNNYSLQYNSPCVNAGDPSLFDPDGTVSDIGALPVYIYLVIEHEPLGNTIDINGPYEVEADIYSTSIISVSANIYYRVNSGAFSELVMVNTSGDSFSGEIPGQEMDSQIDYYIEAVDGENISTHPYNAPESLHTFNISLVEEFSTLSTISNSDGSIGLTWNIPQLYGGSFTGLQLYRSDSEGVTQDTVYADLAADAVSFTDSDLFEGETWYYRLGATIDTGDYITSIFISNETAGTSDEAGIVFVEGQVILDGVDDHSDILVEFERTSPSPITYDTVYTDAGGYYQHMPIVGIYNMNTYKYGWQPGQLGGLYLTQNTTLDTLIMEQGYIAFVGGEISGNWTSNYIYYITSTITVPEGETLTIEAGTLIKFLDYFSFVVDGTLIADGNSENHITFTSGFPIPDDGDWASLVLNSGGNVLRYVDYSYANDGINGENASGSVFDHCTISNLSLEARGIYLTNSSNTTFTNNEISVLGEYGIFTDNSSGSLVNNNTISGNQSTAAIRMEDCDNCQFDSNTITNRSYRGIWAQYADSTSISNNTMDVEYTGIEAQNGSYLTIENNTVTNFEEYGVYFQSSENSIVNYNRLTGANGGGFKRGISNTESNQNAVVNYNYVDVSIDLNEGNYYDQYGIEVYDSEVIGDSVFVYINNDCGSDGRGIRADRSIIDSNYVNIQDHGDCWSAISYAIESYGSSNDRSTITNNTIVAIRETSGIWASYADIENNHIKGPDNNNDEWAIGYGDYNVIKNNTIIGMLDGINVDGRTDNIIEGNSIQVNGWGVYGDNAQNLTITNNTIETNSGTIIYTTNGISNIKYNLLISNAGRGIHCENQAGEEFSNNTIIGSGGDYGIYITDLSDPDVFNNIIQGFQTGIRAESEVSTISYNDLWDNDAIFSGTGLPDLIGEVVTVNINNDPSDVYANIYLDPQFVDQNNADYNLEFTSPCINAGDPEILDPNGTVSEIGAFPYIWLMAESNSSGTIDLQWEASVHPDFVNYDLDYKLMTDEAYSDLTETDSLSYTVEGLTDGLFYEFRLTEILVDGSSGSVSTAVAQAGIPQISLSTNSIALEVFDGDSTTETLTISNSGGQNLEWQLSFEENEERSPLQILGWTFNTTSYYNDTFEALNEHFTDYNLTTSTTYDVDIFEDELEGIDVLVITNQNYMSYVDEELYEVLQNYVTSGGGVIFTGANNDNFGGLFENADYYSSNCCGYTWNSNEFDSSHPIMEGIDILSIFRPYSTQVNDSDVQVIHNTNMWGENFPSTFVKEFGRGKVVVLGTRFEQWYWNDNSEGKMLANAVQWAGKSSWLEVAKTDGTILPGESDDIALTFDGGNIDPGEYGGVITITSNDSNQPESIVDVSLTVNGAPSIELEADNTDFGGVFVGQVSSLALNIINDGSATLDVTDIQVVGEQFSVNITSLSVEAGADTTILVSFMPLSEGMHEANITFFSNDPSNSETSLYFSGTGLIPPDMQVTPESIYMELNSGEVDSSQVITITNNGGSALNFDISFEENPNDTSRSASTPSYSDLLETYADQLVDPDKQTDAMINEMESRGIELHSSNTETAGESGNQKILPREAFTSLRGNMNILSLRGYEWDSGEEEYYINNTYNALSQYFTDYTLTEVYTEYKWSNLEPYLNDADLVLIPFGHWIDQYENNYWEDGSLITDNVLVDYINAGGGVVFTGYNSNNYLIFDWASSWYGWCCGESFLGEDGYYTENHPVMSGVGDKMEFGGEFMISLVNDNSADIIFNMYPWENDEEAEAVIFAKEYGQGKVVVVGSTFWFDPWMGFDYSTDDEARVLSNAVQWAAGGITPNWLELSQEDGTLSPGESIDIGVYINTEGLDGGTYETNINISSNDPQNTVASVSVTLDIPIPEISVTPGSFSAELNAGDIDTTQTLSISNFGGTNLSWDISIVYEGSDDTLFASSTPSYDELMEMYADQLVEPDVQTEDDRLENDPDIEIHPGTTNRAPDMPSKILPREAFTSLRGSMNIISLRGSEWEDPWYANNTYNALSQYFTDYTLTEVYTEYNWSNLEPYLNDADLVLIPYGHWLDNYNDYYWEGDSNSNGNINILRDYVDSGGGVVFTGYNYENYAVFDNVDNNCMFCWCCGYNFDENTYSIGENADHPVMDGVFDDGYVELMQFGLSYVGDSEYEKILNMAGWQGESSSSNHTYAKQYGNGRVVVIHSPFDQYYNDEALMLSNAVQWAASSGWLSFSENSGVVSPESIQDITVTFDATGLCVGDYSADIILTSNGSQPVIELPAALSVSGFSEISLDADSLQFNSLYIGEEQVLTIALENIGADELIIESIQSSNGDFSVSDFVSSIACGGDLDILEISFIPTISGIIDGVITIVSNDETKVIQATGIGLAHPEITVSADSFYVSLAVDETDQQQMSISNIDTVDVDWNISVLPTSGEGGDIMPLAIGNTWTFRNAGYAYVNGDTLTGEFDVEDNDALQTTIISEIISFEGNDYYKWDWEDNMSSDTTIIADTMYTSTFPFIIDDHESTSSRDHDDDWMGWRYDDNGDLFLGEYNSDHYEGSYFTEGKMMIANPEVGASWTTVFDGDYAIVSILEKIDLLTPYGELTDCWRVHVSELNDGDDGDDMYLYWKTGIGLVNISQSDTDWSPEYGDVTYTWEMSLESFYIQGSWLYTETPSGTLNAGESVDIVMTFDAEGLVGGYYAADILLTLNDHTMLTTTIPAEMNVDGPVYAAVIEQIWDVPEDQGNQVYITFQRSFHDTDTLRNSEAYTIERMDNGNWVSLHAISAYGVDSYQTVAATLQNYIDSTNTGMTEFRIIAAMEEGNFASTTSAGYSVDNIHPSTPDNFTLYHAENDEVLLGWNYELEDDFQYHQISSLYETSFTTENSYSFIVSNNDEHWVNAVDINGNLSENSTSIMSINLHAGANLISFNVLPDNPNLSTVLYSLSNNSNGIITEGSAANYSETLGWIGSLTEIESDAGYWVKVSEDDILLLSGQPTKRDTVYSLHTGANLVSYPYRYNTEVSSAIPEEMHEFISGIITEGSATSNSDETGWIGSLSSLKGSKGYWLIVNEAVQFSFNGCDEPECVEDLSRISEKPEMSPEGFEYVQSVEQAFYFLEDIQFLDGTSINENDWVIAYKDAIILGARKWNGAYTDIPVMGIDEQELTAEYAVNGDVPTFMVLRENGDIVTLEGDIPPWSNNSLFAVANLQEALLIPNEYMLSQGYPNPFNPTTKIDFALPYDSDVLIQIYDIQGREVVSLLDDKIDAGYHSIVWNASSYSSGMYFVKMLALSEADGGPSKYLKTQKLMLVK